MPPDPVDAPKATRSKRYFVAFACYLACVTLTTAAWRIGVAVGWFGAPSLGLEGLGSLGGWLAGTIVALGFGAGYGVFLLAACLVIRRHR